MPSFYVTLIDIRHLLIAFFFYMSYIFYVDIANKVLNSFTRLLKSRCASSIMITRLQKVKRMMYSY